MFKRLTLKTFKKKIIMKKAIVMILVVALIMTFGISAVSAVYYTGEADSNGTEWQYLRKSDNNDRSYGYNNCTDMKPNNYNCRWIVYYDSAQRCGYWHNIETKTYYYSPSFCGYGRLSFRTDTEQNSDVTVKGYYYHN